jgi:hypothetical protein
MDAPNPRNKNISLFIQLGKYYNNENCRFSLKGPPIKNQKLSLLSLEEF